MSEGRCACPSPDRYDCIRIRYRVELDEAIEEPCECDCHYESDYAQEDDPFWEDAGA